jgi:hypothetical protein
VRQGFKSRVRQGKLLYYYTYNYYHYRGFPATARRDLPGIQLDEVCQANWRIQPAGAATVSSTYCGEWVTPSDDS